MARAQYALPLPGGKHLRMPALGCCFCPDGCGYIESDYAPGTYYPCNVCNPKWSRVAFSAGCRGMTRPVESGQTRQPNTAQHTRPTFPTLPPSSEEPR